MATVIILMQITVAVSVFFVWTFRFENVIKEFKLFELSDLTRSLVGASKIALATLLVVGIWHSALTPVSAALMGLFMLSAQFFHFRAKSPMIKRLPSFLFLALCIFMSVTTLDALGI
jgi:hypothetical protein